jgi:hypothetical protein
VLANIETGLRETITELNKKKPLDFAENTRKTFKASFVKQGEHKKPSKSAQPEARGYLSYANDWKMLVDYEDNKMVFPPLICSTNLRPDVVIWSKLTREVILLELTVCAEEGIDAAQLRKESKYTNLLEEINATKCWKAQLFTLEIGARGLVSSRAYGTFTKLGLTGRSAKKLCKALSTVAARCSYAIYLAHNNRVWCRSDLVTLPVDPRVTGVEDETAPTSPSLLVNPRVTGIEDKNDPKAALLREDPRTNLSVLQAKGIKTLFHFTDAANVESIRKNGLMSASNLLECKIESMMNSDELSRNLDKSLGLQDYVRLSFNDKNPMMFVALKQQRVSKPVVLQIKLEVVSRSNVMFTDCNATRRDAKKSSSPEIVYFDVVKAKDQFAVPPELKHFYQAEVLVPSPIPPDLILFDAPDDEMTLRGAAVDSKFAADASVSRCSDPISSYPAPVVLVRPQELKCKLQMKKYHDLSRCFAAFADQLKKSHDERVQGEKVKLMKSTSVRNAELDDDDEDDDEVKTVCCEMPLCDKKDSCADCAEIGPFADCPKGHMRLCRAPDVFVACDHCHRLLCSRHFVGCYCLKRIEEPFFRMYRLSFLPPQSSSSSVKKTAQRASSKATITKKPPGGPGKQQMLKR